jgi:2-hydroxychromene-2-carboxylate isomerase
MMMRGVPAPRAKQLYIIRDAAREARFRDVDFGHIVDPFGDPVRRAFALFPAAQALGKGLQFVTAYLDAAWTRGVDITTQTGLRRVVESAGLNWQALNDMSRGTDWQALLDENLQAMLESGLWGVPSFRVTGGGISESFSCWGQDRLWRVEAEILSRMSTN